VNRRKYLTFVCLAAALPGCTNTTDDEGDDTDNKDSTTGSATSTTTEDEECGPYTVCAGGELISVNVNNGFDSEVRLELDCRDESYTLNPGASITVERNTDGETCQAEVYINGMKRYETELASFNYERISVLEDGDVEYQSYAK